VNLEEMNHKDLVDLVKKLRAKRKYGLVWADQETPEYLEKKDSFPILRTNKEKSLYSEKNSNILIEGDNFYGLSILKYSHYEKIDVIYIDPPYNTGNTDFKYNDRWILKDSPYRHSSWLTFMDKRLRIAKELLKNDGLIFISIDDNELAQLKMLCDDIFGERNFIANFVWEKKRKASNLDGKVRGITEYVLAYGKPGARPIIHPFDKVEEEKPYPFYNSGNSRSILVFPPGMKFSSLPDGIYKKSEFKAKKTLVKLLGDVTISNGVATSEFSLEGEWRYSQKWLNSALVNDEEIVFKGVDFKPYWINRNADRSKKMKTLLNYDNYQIGTNEDGNEELFRIIGENNFSFPKPTSLIKALIQASTESDSQALILDFFAGSGTTGDAVLQLNSEDGGNRQFILVTNNEQNICDDVCLPRLVNIIKGFTTPDSIEISGYGGGLKFFEIDFVEKSSNSDEMYMRISDYCTEFICLRENTLYEIESSDKFKMFQTETGIVTVYHSFDLSDLGNVRDTMLRNLSVKKILYVFAFDDENLNSYFDDWGEIDIRGIPSKIMDILRESNV